MQDNQYRDGIAGDWRRQMIELNSFICGDCMDYLPRFPDKYFDLANKRLEEYKSQITLFDLGIERK